MKPDTAQAAGDLLKALDGLRPEIRVMLTEDLSEERWFAEQAYG
jgi:hypothetical protein